MAKDSLADVIQRLEAVKDVIEAELKARSKAETAKEDSAKAQEDAKAGEEDAKKQKPPHLRTGGKDGDKDGIPDECSTCVYYKGGQSGTCQKYDWPVDGGEVCDSYEAKQAEGKKDAEEAEVLLHPGSIKLLEMLNQLISEELESRDGKTGPEDGQPV